MLKIKRQILKMNSLKAFSFYCFVFLLPASLFADPPKVLDERLELHLFLEDPKIATPVALTADDANRIWVIESNTHFPKGDYNRHTSDRLWVLQDRNGDNKADENMIMAADGFQHAMALMYLKKGTFVLGTRKEIFLLEDTDEDIKIDKRTLLAGLDTSANYPHNGLSGFALDELGYLYFSQGENFGKNYTLTARDGSFLKGSGEGGNIFRMSPEGKNLSLWSTGFWNPFALATNTSGDVFTIDNDPDSRPPCRLIHAIEGGQYGYRYDLGRSGLHPFIAWDGQHPDTLPMTAGTGEGPTGLVCYENEAFPQEYFGDLLSTSWGDHKIERFKLQKNGASYRAFSQILVQGDRDFRPTGMTQTNHGEIFFGDWISVSYNVHNKGKIWKLNVKKEHRGLADIKTKEDFLGHPNRSARYFARSLWLQRKSDRLIEETKKIVTESKNLNAQLNGLKILAKLKKIDGPLLKNLSQEGRSEIVAGKAWKLFSLLNPEKDPPIPSKILGPQHLYHVLHSCKKPEPYLEQIKTILAERKDSFLYTAAILALTRGPESIVTELASSKKAQLRLAALMVNKRKNNNQFLNASWLADADIEVRRAAAQWAGQSGRKDLVEALEKSLRVVPLNRELFQTIVAALKMLGANNSENKNKEALKKLASDQSVSPAARAIALRLAASTGVRLNTELIPKFASSDSPILRREAVRQLWGKRDSESQKILGKIALDTNENVSIRRDAIVGLTSQVGPSFKTLQRLMIDSNTEVVDEAKKALAYSAKNPQEIPEGKGLSALLLKDGKKILQEAFKRHIFEEGHPEEGERIFYNASGASCGTCHRLNDLGGKVGPDLTNATHMSTQRIVESILEPNKEVSPQFTTWNMITKQGPKTGTILQAGGQHKFLMGFGDGTQQWINEGDVLIKEQKTESLMPANLIDRLTIEEFAHLVAFLRNPNYALD